MDIKDIKKDLNLIYFTYDDDNKAFSSTMDSSVVIAEFSKILDKLEANNVKYNVINMNYIKLDI